MSGSQSKVVPFSLKNAPALIERIFPVQRLSAESRKEQEARQSKTLTALGSYWKGRKPLILNKACILGALIPATDSLEHDLEIFELLMAMDDESLKKRLRSNDGVISQQPYREIVELAARPEEVGNEVHSHIWSKVNSHLKTSAHSFPELVEQLGVMRFGRRPIIGDTFSGSGQVPFEAARLGAAVYASDLNPVAAMLTWGTFNIVGGSESWRRDFARSQEDLYSRLQNEIDSLEVESDGEGWNAKAFLYCVEVKCPVTGWDVPLLPTLIISGGHRVHAILVPDPLNKRYEIQVRYADSDLELQLASKGTVRSDGKGQEAYLHHVVDHQEIKIKLSTLRGETRTTDGVHGNNIRLWERADFRPRPSDLFQERLYGVLWVRPKGSGKGVEHNFRGISIQDLDRERKVSKIVESNLDQWQELGWIPDMRIESGYNTDQPIRERGWTYWHHLFNPRQLLIGALSNQFTSTAHKLAFFQTLNINSRLSRWNYLSGVGQTAGVFDNQALNTLYNYGCRGIRFLESTLKQQYRSFPLSSPSRVRVSSHPAEQIQESVDVFVTDPPYGDAVKYEEILEFFIAWLRKNPPAEFAEWTWDSRRALAIKGEDEDFRRGMVAAYKRMAECMPDNGIQIIMFTHQSGSIWADMANIVWASGLHVTAAWYVVTETDSALREGSYVKGTVLLVLRKRTGELRTTRDDLAWDIKDEVERQVATLTGLNQQTKARYRDENLFADADIQMAGYAAALRVLTQYSVIDGREMAAESIRPRVKGQKTFVDELIEFAVGVANQALVPSGIERSHWEKFKPAERFYLKLIELESQGAKTLDNYQNFAKAFKVADFRPLMAQSKANAARLKSAVELGKQEMSDGAELGNTALRGVLYAIMELTKGEDGNDVLTHLSFNVENYFDPEVREVLSELADYLASKLVELRPEEASAARVLRELIRNQRL
jgi:putative DNA methylase